MRIGVSGLARVSGTKSEWEVDCTYSFSPVTGLILIHTINSIHPAPHESVYEAFRLGFGRLGLGFSPEPRTGAQGTICKGSIVHYERATSDVSTHDDLGINVVHYHMVLFTHHHSTNEPCKSRSCD